MERRMKVWLTVLIVLLIAAIVAVLGVNGQLSGSKTALEAANTLLSSEQEKNETLTADYESMSTKLTETEGKVAELEAELNAENQQNTDAQTTISTLETEIAEYQAQIAELEVLIAAENVQPETVSVEPANIETPQPEAPQAEAEHGDVSNVDTPESLRNAEKVDVETVYANIDAIMNAETANMSDAEKVAALDALKAELGGYVEELNAALDEISAHETALEESAGSIETLEAELKGAQDNVETLNDAIRESEDTIAQLQAQVDALTSENQNASADAQAQMDALNAQIAAEQEKINALTEELNAANARLEKLTAELEAYKLERELAAGDAHAAATLEETLNVQADGRTVRWAYTNDTISGNAVVLSIRLNDEELYTSAALQPGESLPAFELKRTLETGEYEAVAVASVYDANGEFLSATRIPVKICVE